MIVEHGDIARNIDYARQCVCDSLKRGEAPLASHLLYTQDGILNDNNPEERRRGIAAGHVWISLADALVVYNDYGISQGMEEAIDYARFRGITVEYRKILEANP